MSDNLLSTEFFPRQDSHPISHKSYAIDWTLAPAWANYHAFHEWGQGMFFSHRPRIYYGQCFWQVPDRPADAQEEPSHIAPVPRLDWRLSLAVRPIPPHI